MMRDFVEGVRDMLLIVLLAHAIVFLRLSAPLGPPAPAEITFFGGGEPKIIEVPELPRPPVFKEVREREV